LDGSKQNVNYEYKENIKSHKFRPFGGPHGSNYCDLNNIDDVFISEKFQVEHRNSFRDMKSCKSYQKSASESIY